MIGAVKSNRNGYESRGLTRIFFRGRAAEVSANFRGKRGKKQLGGMGDRTAKCNTPTRRIACESQRRGVFQHIKAIGRGSFGEVSLVRCLRTPAADGNDDDVGVRTGQRYALKAVAYGDSLRRQKAAAREVGLLASVKHPCVVSLLDCFVSRGADHIFASDVAAAAAATVSALGAKKGEAAAATAPAPVAAPVSQRTASGAGHQLFIVMEFCEFGTLARVLKYARRAVRKRVRGVQQRGWGGGPMAAPHHAAATVPSIAAPSSAVDGHALGYLSEERVFWWFGQLCLALHFLHGSRVLHRDLKPANVFVGADEGIKVGDFGLSRVLQDTGGLAVSEVGTPHYTAPEICSNKPYSFPADVWSLGCMLHEMMTLAPPFEGKTLFGLAQNILTARPSDRFSPPLAAAEGLSPADGSGTDARLASAMNVSARYSEQLCALVAQCLSKQPEHRPTVAQLLANPLVRSASERFVGNCPIGAGRPLLEQQMRMTLAATGSGSEILRRRPSGNASLQGAPKLRAGRRAATSGEVRDIRQAAAAATAAAAAAEVAQRVEEAAQALREKGGHAATTVRRAKLKPSLPPMPTRKNSGAEAGVHRDGDKLIRMAPILYQEKPLERGLLSMFNRSGAMVM